MTVCDILDLVLSGWMVKSKYISGKPDRARIRVEHIIREDYYCEAMEMIEMYCDLLLARFGLIRETQTIDSGLEESVSSIIWAGPRIVTDIPGRYQSSSVNSYSQSAIPIRTTQELTNASLRFRDQNGLRSTGEEIR